MIIIDPNSDYNVLFGRMLVLINELSFAKDEKKALTIERIVIYDYFLRSPLVLAKVLKILDKKLNIDIKENEVDAIETVFPAYSDLYKFSNAKKLIQLLDYEGMIELSKEDDGTLYVSISTKGKQMVNSLESDYFLRLKEVSKAIALLHAVSFSSLRSGIKTLIYE